MANESIYRQLGQDPLYKIWHSSDEHLMMYFHSDGGSIVCADAMFPIKKGALIFIAANTYHYTMPDAPESYDRSKLTISRERFTAILQLLSENNRFKAFSEKAIVYAEIDEDARHNIERLFNDSVVGRAQDDQELYLLSCCMTLLLYLDRYSKASAPSVSGGTEKAVDYINKNIAQELTIDRICAAVNMSKYHFCRQFKQHTGMTTMAYILKTRIMLAKSDLEKTDLSITEISEKYGFSSVSYFSRIFKAEENCSPRQYRKRKRA